MLIELDGTRIVTDPLLRGRMFHLRRKTPVPDVSGVDAVLISHVHWDHLDRPSLARLPKDATIVVPRGARKLVQRTGFAHIEELVPGENIRLDGVDVRATQALHDVDSWPRRASAPALGFVTVGSQTIYFAGDTDVFPEMAELAPGLDVALLPIAGWGPTLPPGHMDARAAAGALTLLKPRLAIPIHWGTYAVVWARAHRAADPAEEFRTIAATLAPDVEVAVLAVGETITVSSA